MFVITGIHYQRIQAGRRDPFSSVPLLALESCGNCPKQVLTISKVLQIPRENHLSNTTRLPQVFFESGEWCSPLRWSLAQHKTHNKRGRIRQCWSLLSAQSYVDHFNYDHLLGYPGEAGFNQEGVSASEAAEGWIPLFGSPFGGPWSNLRVSLSFQQHVFFYNHTNQ